MHAHYTNPGQSPLQQSTEKLPKNSAQHYSWKEMPKEVLSPHLDRRLITGIGMMIAHIELKKGGIVPKHSHHNEQIVYIVRGALKFRLGEDQREEIVVSAGEVLVIPPHVPHSAEALEDTLDIDIFNPPRHDWLEGKDDYLRQGDQK